MTISALDTYDDKVVIPSIRQAIQRDFFVPDDSVIELQPASPHVHHECPDLDLSSYTKVIICMSGGKDSIASMLRIIEAGYPVAQMELWHHLVDGSPSEPVFADWSFMHDYCKQLSAAFNITLYSSWLEQGFKGEMLKNNSTPKPHTFETPDGFVTLGRDRAKPGTRRLFPQQKADLRQRWCSGALKIDVGRRALNNQERFYGHRTLFVTGERRAESPLRSRLDQLTPHLSDTARNKNPIKPRYIDSYKNVLHLSEEDVWETLERWRIVPPVPYRLHFSRSSCQICIFNSDKVFSTMRLYWPERLREIAYYEKEFGKSIARSGKRVDERALLAKPYELDDIEALEQSLKKKYELPIFVPDGQTWKLPPGAFSTEKSGSV